MGEAVRTGGLTDAALDDYAISRELGGAVAARADYGWQLEAEPPFVLFAYPPPDALLHAALAALGGLAGPLLFMAALAAAGWAGARSVLTLLGAEELPLRWLGVLLGVLACRAFVQSDLHLLNSNVLAVGLALAAWRFLDPTSRRPLGPACGGLLLAASLAVKPWAVGLPLVLVALRRWRELGWTLSGLGLAFVVVPALMLGPGDAAKLLASWIDVLRQAASVAAIDRIKTDPPDVVLTDLRMSPVDGMEVLQAARDQRPPVETLVFTAFGDIEIAVNAMRMGARDYLTKPVTVEQVLSRLDQIRTGVSGPHPDDSSEPLIAESPASQLLMEAIEAAASVPSRLWIEGEIGSGRVFCAQKIHALAHADEPFHIRDLGQDGAWPEHGTVVLPNVDDLADDLLGEFLWSHANVRETHLAQK